MDSYIQFYGGDKSLNKKMTLEEINEEWRDMPEFFGKELDQTNKIWVDNNLKSYKSRYPIYIVSKGRAKHPRTARYFESIKMPYKIVIEPQEFKEYSKVISEKKILVLPFSNLGLGSIPARNWIWEHSIKMGFKRHWIWDDNISAIRRKYNGLRRLCESGNSIVCMENFVDRYTNVGMAGLNYQAFGPPNIKKPFYVNTRVYSAILLDNSLPFRWRGKYNEDTDLSLRILKSGLTTILFNAFLIDKAATMTMPGGNDKIYKESKNRTLFVKSLIKQHPDIVSMDTRWNRPHHVVDYSGFTQPLIKKQKLRIPKKINNYNMVLVDRKKYKKFFTSPF